MSPPHPGQFPADPGPADALRFFFEDVAALPVIDGKHGYLPLTRRIRRAEALAALDGATPGQKLAALRQALRPLRGDRARANGRGPALDLARLDGEIEAFLDDPDQTAPPALQALARQVDRDDEASDRLWRDFYWLALLPPGSRRDDDVTIEAAAAHFAHARAEGRAARADLLVGTLRYVVNIAADYANRGLPYLDLVQEGFFGLARATSGFDERKGHFQQYAAAWIRQRMDRAIAEKAALIRIPVHIREKVTQAEKAEKATELVERAEEHETDCQGQKQAKQRQQLAIATAAHYSLERARLPLIDEDGEPLTIADVLAAPDDVEGDVEERNFSRFLRAYLESGQSPLTPRQRDVLYRRFGFDGEAMTLEEIGRADGVTRERIRQIEAKAKSELEYHLPRGKMKQRLLPPQRKAFLPLPLTLSAPDGLRAADRILPPTEDLARVQGLIQVYVRRGRRTRWTVGRMSRTELLGEVLRELGRPVHYSVIHERAMALVPEGKQFSKRETYNRLFYDSHLFRFHGHAVFGLVAWGDGAIEVEGELVFRHCPAPLLPPGAPPAAFFDSLELGRRLLAERPHTAADFWRAMRAWAGEGAEARPQEAFNAWYAAGLLGPVRYETEAASWLTLTAPTDASLAELRAHALAAAARRVERLPELLLGLDSLGRPTTEALAWLLYGRADEGYEVAARLRLLVGLGGARAVGDTWQLTEAGRAALAALPAADLPDEPPPPEEELLDLVDLDVYALEFDD